MALYFDISQDGANTMRPLSSCADNFDLEDDFLNFIDPQTILQPVNQLQSTPPAKVFEQSHSFTDVSELWNELNGSLTVDNSHSELNATWDDLPDQQPSLDRIDSTGIERWAGLEFSDVRYTGIQIAPSALSWKNEVEDSWNEDEHAGSASRYLQRLRDMIRNVASTPGATATTAPLPLRMRRVVHLLAHLEHCSHMSIGTGPERRVMIASDSLQLQNPMSTKITRCWNRSTSSFCIDPKTIKIKNIPGDLSQKEFEEAIARNDIPAPRISSYHRRHSGDSDLGVAFAVFEDTEDVTVFVHAFQHHRLRASDGCGLVLQFARIPRLVNYDRPEMLKTAFTSVQKGEPLDADPPGGVVRVGQQATRENFSYGSSGLEPYGGGYSSGGGQSSAGYSAQSRDTQSSSDAFRENATQRS